MTIQLHKLDTDKQVFFYEQEFYVLSNFSAFSIKWKGYKFQTSEHAYHWEKFLPGTKYEDIFVRDAILSATSAHAAFKLAQSWGYLRRDDWDSIKVNIMRNIIKAKLEQHEYVKQKLIETGNRELIEDSWRDDFWGWGPNKDGKNMLGKLWMEVRDEMKLSLI